MLWPTFILMLDINQYSKTWTSSSKFNEYIEYKLFLTSMQETTFNYFIENWKNCIVNEF